MKRFTTEGTNDQEGLGLIPAQRRAEEEALGLSFEGGGVAVPRKYSRRQALGLVGGSLAGVSLLSFGLAAPAEADLPGIDHNDIITLKCLGDKPGPRYLDGRTQDGTVGLAPNTNPPFTGTKWLVEYLNPNAGPDQYWVYNHIFLSCQGTGPGDARYLDGRTQDGTVGLAPNTNPPFTGTRWHLEYHKDTNPDTYPSHAGYFLHCEGKEPGPRWLDGRTQDGTVGLAPDSNTYKGYTGTRWAIDVVGKSR